MSIFKYCPVIDRYLSVCDYVPIKVFECAFNDKAVALKYEYLFMFMCHKKGKGYNIIGFTGCFFVEESWW